VRGEATDQEGHHHGPEITKDGIFEVMNPETDEILASEFDRLPPIVRFDLKERMKPGERGICCQIIRPKTVREAKMVVNRHVNLSV
jgi:hypothetical protein